MPTESFRLQLSRAVTANFSYLDIRESHSGKCQAELAELFGKTTILARAAFLICICMQQSDLFRFPSESYSRRILEVVLAFGQSLKFCKHCGGELFRVSPSVLRRLCQSTSTALSDKVCSTLCLYMAATAPVAIDTGDRIVGILYDSRCIASMPSTPERLLCISAEGNAVGQSICQLSFNGKRLYVSVLDTPSAAVRCPLELTSLRSMRMGYNNRRVVSKWFIQHTKVHTRPIQCDAVLQSAFTDSAAADEWYRLAGLVAGRSCSLAARTECRDKMLALLPHCRSEVVQQVLDLALRPQPPLDEPFYGVYVLCSHVGQMLRRRIWLWWETCPHFAMERTS